MTPHLPAPLDVKLMNFTASVMLASFVLLVLAFVLAWTSRHPAFAIRGIVLAGDVGHSHATELRSLVVPQLSGTFLTINLAQARQAFEATPWVRRAEVRRQFPNRLRILLQEHQPVAFWGAEGESTLVNSFGEVFEANLGEVEQENLPRLNGPQGQSAQVLSMYQALQSLLTPVNLSIEMLELTGRGNWHAELDTGASIELGRGMEDEVKERAVRFVGTLAQVTSRYGRTAAALEMADLRHKDGYAIRLRGVSTVQTEQQK